MIKSPYSFPASNTDQPCEVVQTDRLLLIDLLICDLGMMLSDIVVSSTTGLLWKSNEIMSRKKLAVSDLVLSTQQT